MKIYPYQTPEGIIELVEKREYDKLSLLAHELATLRAEDMATINDLRKQLQDAVKRMEDDEDKATHDAEIIVKKQRETGWTGILKLKFDPHRYTYRIH
jgi:hypothetical protein